MAATNLFQKKLVFILFIIVLLILTACEQTSEIKKEPKVEKETISNQIEEESEHNPELALEDITYAFEHPLNDQSYQIIHAYKLYDRFIEKLEKDPNSSEYYLYKQEVLNPVHDVCFQNVGYPDVIKNVPSELDQIQYIYEKIDSERINEIVKDALIKSSDVLPSDKETNICIFPVNVTTMEQGLAMGDGKFFIFLNKFFNVEGLPPLVAHEYHHTFWLNKYWNEVQEWKILDNLVLEGKAVMFEKLLYPESTYTTIVNYSFNKDYWSKIESDLLTTDWNRSNQILMGGNGLPRVYGYSEGFKMVKSYLDLYPDTTIEEWTAISAEEIYEKGRYSEKYN